MAFNLPTDLTGFPFSLGEVAFDVLAVVQVIPNDGVDVAQRGRRVASCDGFRSHAVLESLYNQLDKDSRFPDAKGTHFVHPKRWGSASIVTLMPHLTPMFPR